MERRGPFLPVIGSLIALAWITLALWERSPYGRYLDHGDWTATGLAAEICRVLPSGRVMLPALLYVVGWLLMSVAMMLPGIVPLLDIFRRVSSARADRHILLALVVAGYLAVWLLFGIAARGLDLELHGILGGSALLAPHAWLLGAGVIALAGAFELSPLKHFCLDKCRTPMSFVIQHWRGRAHRRQAMLLGLHHGAFCVGCCWAIMLVMLAVGMGNVGLMLAFGAAMAIEKNMAWGARMSTPLGAGLLGWAAVILAAHLAG
jgi:predicted metal-binding membrane protein